MSGQQYTILVYVGLDLVGDGLMKLPFLRALRACYPGAHITWLAGKGATVYASSLKPLTRGLLDEVIEHGDIGTHWRELLRRPMQGRPFDLIIDTQRRVLTTLILKRIPHRRFISGAADYFFSDAKPARRKLKQPSMLGQMLSLLLLATGKPLPPPVPLQIDPQIDDLADQRLPGGEIYVGIAPGAGGRHKCWPLDNYIALALRQAKTGRRPVILLGPAEREWEGEFRDVVPDAIYPLETGGSPLLTIALGRRLSVAVANDSGIGHMLAASEIPLISLFGPTPPEKFAPATPWLNVIRAQDFGTGADMNTIPLTAVSDRVDLLLDQPPEGFRQSRPR